MMRNFGLPSWPQVLTHKKLSDSGVEQRKGSVSERGGQGRCVHVVVQTVCVQSGAHSSMPGVMLSKICSTDSKSSLFLVRHMLRVPAPRSSVNLAEWGRSGGGEAEGVRVSGGESGMGRYEGLSYLQIVFWLQ